MPHSKKTPDSTARPFGTARDLNPDAGTHAVSVHPDERAAAEAATRQSWREFPYYARRYGERGWRFSLSDSGWIATLSDASDSEAVAQTEWLARLLAARGMPRYLMEKHLINLHGELSRRLPQLEPRFRVLIQCAAALTSARLTKLSGDDFRRLAREFEERVSNDPARVANMGVVLVAAVSDEAAGIEGAAENVRAWATDSSRFGAAWIDAVEDTVRAARALASGEAVAGG